MQKTLIYLLSLVLLTLANCAGEPEDIPPGFTTDPVFHASVLIDGQALDFTAGIDGYALTPEHKTVDGIVRYDTYLHPESCNTGCASSLRFRFWGSADSSGNNHLSTFQTGTKEYYDQQQEQSVTLEFGVAEELGTPGSAAFWASGGSNNPAQVFVKEAGPDEIVELCYNSMEGFAGTSNCVSSYCFHMRVDAPCIGWLKAEKVYGNNVLIEPVLMGEGPYAFAWMNGSTAPFILLPLTENITRGVQVRIHGPDDCVIEINQTVQISSGIPRLCPADPGFFLNSYPSPFDQYNSVSLEYIDDSGKVYSSASGSQGLDQTHFEIHATEPFVESPMGFPTIKLSGTLSCMLYSNDGQSIALEIPEYVIAVSRDE